MRDLACLRHSDIVNFLVPSILGPRPVCVCVHT